MNMRKLAISLMILFVLCGCSSKTNSVTANLEINNSLIPIFHTSAYDEKTLDGLGIKLSSTNIAPGIRELEVRKITEDLLRKTAAQPKGIYLEYGLIMANVGIGAISAEAKNANPVLKNKKSILDVPVWVITFKGLLPDDFVPDHRGKEPLDISSTVIDAITGEVLFGFGIGRMEEKK